MTWFLNLKTAHKLALGFGLCLLLTTVLGGVAIARMTQLNAATNIIVSNSVTRMTSLAHISDGIRNLRLLEYEHSTTHAARYESEMAITQTTVQSAMDTYGAGLANPIDRQNFSDLKSAWQQYIQLHDAFLPASRARRTQEAQAELDGPMQRQYDALTEQLTKMQKWNVTRAVQYDRTAQETYDSGRSLIVAIWLVVILSGIAASWYISRYLTETVTQISGRLEKLRGLCITNFEAAIRALEEGDLTCPITTGTEHLDVQSQDEFGQVAQTFNAMLTQVQSTIGSFRQSQVALADVVRGVQQSSTQVAGAAKTLATVSSQVEAGTDQISAAMNEVSQASDQSARGASEIAQGSSSQAQSLSISTELVKELAAAVLSVARDAEGAGQAAGRADTAARQGDTAVVETMAGMERIRRTVVDTAEVIQELGQASTRIGGIIATIDEIADQTNLLALNAAIEAARAGESGRGFAVVADEVRKLAERSSSATKEIRSLISDIQGRTSQAIQATEAGTQDVQAGSALAAQAGDALQEIKHLVGELTRQVQDIGAAAEEMSASADEVARSIADVAAVVEESSAAAEEVSASAEQVSTLIRIVSGTTGQQSASVEKMVTSAEELTGVTRALDETIARFKVGGAGTAQVDAPQLKMLKVA